MLGKHLRYMAGGLFFAGLVSAFLTACTTRTQVDASFSITLPVIFNTSSRPGPSPTKGPVDRGGTNVEGLPDEKPSSSDNASGGSGSGGGSGFASAGGGSIAFEIPNRYSIVRIAGRSVGGNVVGTQALGASFSSISGLAIGNDGTLYVCDAGNHQIRAYPKTGNPSIIAGAIGGNAGFVADNVTAVSARLDTPLGLAIDVERTVLYVCDSGNQRIRNLVPGGRIYTTVGGGDDPSANVADARQAALDTPYGIALDALGNLYFSERGAGRIRRMAEGGQLTTLSSLPPNSIGPLAVSLDGRFMWLGEGEKIRLLHLSPAANLDAAPVATFTGEVVSGLAYDQAGTLYAALNSSLVSETTRGRVVSIPIGARGDIQADGSAVAVAGSGQPVDTPATVDVAADREVPAAGQALTNNGPCALSIDLVNALTPGESSGRLYLGMNFSSSVSPGWGSVLRVTPAL